MVWAARCYRSAISLSWKNSECRLTKARAHLNLSMETQLHHPSMRSPAGDDHDSRFELPNEPGGRAPIQALELPKRRSRNDSAAQCMSWPVRLLLFEHPAQSHRQFARYHYFADAGVLFFAAQALVGTP